MSQEQVMEVIASAFTDSRFLRSFSEDADTLLRRYDLTDYERSALKDMSGDLSPAGVMALFMKLAYSIGPISAKFDEELLSLSDALRDAVLKSEIEAIQSRIEEERRTKDCQKRLQTLGYMVMVIRLVVMLITLLLSMYSPHKDNGNDNR